MRKRLSSGQKWFLRPYFPLIRGMFVLRSGLRFSFRALEVPKPRKRKRLTLNLVTITEITEMVLNDVGDVENFEIYVSINNLELLR